MAKHRAYIDPKLWDAEWLRERYVAGEWSLKRIAREVGCTYPTVIAELERLGIPRRPAKRPPAGLRHLLRDEAWLRSNYIEQGRTVSRMAVDAQCSTVSMRKALHSVGIHVSPNPVAKVKIGDRYGTRVVLDVPEHGSPPRGSRMCLVRCDCGREYRVSAGDLRQSPDGSCRSCQVKRAHRTHGQSKSRTYQAWTGMRNRTSNPRNPKFKNYGERGIVYCEGFASFEWFFADLGEHPGDGYSLDRIDNDGNYSCGHCEECAANGWPANCRWGTALEQARNRRRSRISVDRITDAMIDAAMDVYEARPTESKRLKMCDALAAAIAAWDAECRSRS